MFMQTLTYSKSWKHSLIYAPYKAILSLLDVICHKQELSCSIAAIPLPPPCMPSGYCRYIRQWQQALASFTFYSVLRFRDCQCLHSRICKWWFLRNSKTCCQRLKHVWSTLLTGSPSRYTTRPTKVASYSISLAERWGKWTSTRLCWWAWTKGLEKQCVLPGWRYLWVKVLLQPWMCG